MTRYRVYIIALWVCVMFIVSCTPQVPSKYIQPDDMEDILYDYHMSQAMANKDYDRVEQGFKQSMYYYAVLQKHDVTEAEFDSSLVYYYTHTERLANIYTRISRRMEDEAMRLGASVGDINKYSQYAADGDTANVWNEATSLLLTPNSPYNRYSFNIIPDSTYKAGDTFLFQFDTDFLVEDGGKEANTVLMFTYEGDSVTSHHNIIRASGMSQLRVTCDSRKPITEIRGFIYFGQGSKREGLRLLFIDRIQLIRFHKIDKNNN